MYRLITGVVLLVVLWATIVPAPPAAFVALIVVAVTLACHEGLAMMRALGTRPLAIVGILAGWAVVATAVAQPGPVPLALPVVLGGIVIAASAMATRETPAAMLHTAAGTFLAPMLALLLSFLVALRSQPEVGRELLAILFFAVVLGDSGAYYAGRTLGRHRLAPTISPKKTWEGVAGGVLAGTLGVLAVRWLWLPDLAVGHAVVLGLLLTSTGIVGDLAVSAVKRASGVKDSSALLPGHGGALDRLDSLLFTAPVLYYYYLFFV